MSEHPEQPPLDPPSGESTRPERDLPRVRFLAGSRNGTEIVVPAEGCTLGRSHRCSVRLDQATDTLVSGLHAAIGKNPDGSWWIEDLGSTNGTWLNERRISGKATIPIENELTLGKPRTPGSVCFYVAFPALRREARANDAFAQLFGEDDAAS